VTSEPQAVLDVGSNTIRLLVAVLEGDTIHRVADESRFVRLGAGLDRTGHLAPDRRQAAIEAIRELANSARGHGATELRAVATSAVREAQDGLDFAQDVERQTGIRLGVLSGDEEARYTFLGATLRVEYDHGALVADIGGGSTELIEADSERHIVWSQSLPLGSGRLTDRFVHSDPPSAADREAMERSISELVAPLPVPHASLLVMTGGTASTVAALATGGPTDGTTVLSRSDISRIEGIAYSVPEQTLIDQFRVQPERAPVLPAGATLLRRITEYAQADHLLVTRYGIREGVLRESSGAGPSKGVHWCR